MEIVTLHQQQWCFSGKTGPGCHLWLKIVKMTVGLEKISNLVRQEQAKPDEEDGNS